MGLGYDLARSVCRVMNKKCEHSVYYNYKKALDNTGMSLGRWMFCFVIIRSLSISLYL